MPDPPVTTNFLIALIVISVTTAGLNLPAVTVLAQQVSGNPGQISNPPEDGSRSIVQGHSFYAGPSALPNPPTMALSSIALSSPPPFSGFSVPVGQQPWFATYDPENGYVYVPDYGSANLTVLNGTSIVGSIRPLGTSPDFAVFDPVNGYVYALSEHSDTTTVISGTTIVATLTVGMYPSYAICDSDNGYVYVTNAGLMGQTSNVSIISGTSVIGSVAVGIDPYYPGFDSNDGLVYVPNYLSNNVSIINGSAVVGTVPASAPTSAIYDSGNGLVYVTDEGNGTVSVISRTHVIDTIGVGGSPWFETYDNDDGLVYIVNVGNSSGLGYVTVINGTRVVGSIVVGDSPTAATYDSSNGYDYVINRQSNNVSVINGTALLGSFAVGSAPIAAVYDPGNEGIYVADSGSSNVTVVFTGYRLNFTETGLPPGIGWSVKVGRGLSNISYSSAVVLYLPNGSYRYSIVPADSSYRANPGTLIINGGSIHVMVTFVLVTFPVTLMEHGLPQGTNWSIVFSGSRLSSITSTIVSFEPNGSYIYELGRVPGWSAPGGVGSLQVQGIAANLTFDFSISTFRTTFVETGLPSTTEWWVTIFGGFTVYSNTSGLFIAEPNGTYTYSVSSADKVYSSPQGSFIVAGAAVHEAVAFSRVTFAVGFTESGLPEGTSWSVELGGELARSTGIELAIHEPNGTYDFTVGAVNGFTSNPSSGSIVVNGNGSTRAIAFAANYSPPPRATTILGLSANEVAVFVAGPSAAIVLAICFVIFKKRRGRLAQEFRDF
jgi:YVTN family beta-propeller protein